ncbi:MAG: hypothetical protein Dbin4_01693 [Alphaproteobacteria bacterium]|nr:hypothetical protein [Alphaproteobacteria bacterium]
MMYARLKERCVRLLVRRAKVNRPRRAKGLIASGICHDDSSRSAGSKREANPDETRPKSARDKLPITDDGFRFPATLLHPYIAVYDVPIL